ncbi:hypothetical protein ACFFS4_33795 [Kutzneria kofuensis]|uniref:Uncharacterized protein n=1 Tax=Kutzneria kofuensis TaxID=103725 RepID=A0A7W9KR50_9PSEU|nr:hypothetical protein [Kutzneria kofuensis]MBB5897176.1 hypothetical protein [Kutzneria kofuensis]
MADNTVADQPRPVPDDTDVMLPRGWAEAFLSQLAADGEDEPNVVRGLD